MQPTSLNTKNSTVHPGQSEKCDHKKMLLSLAAIESKLKELEEGNSSSVFDNFAKFSSSLRSVILNLLVIMLFICVFIVAWKDFSTDYLTVDKINLPKSLKEIGYTEAIVARQIIDTFQMNVNGAETEKVFDSFDIISDRQFYLATGNSIKLTPRWKRADLILPGTGTTVQSMLSYLKHAFDHNDRVISGEIISENNVYKLNIRINGGRENYAPITIAASNNIDELVSRASDALVGTVSPFIYAYQNLDKNPDLSLHYIEMRSGKHAQLNLNAWHYHLWGMVLSHLQKYDEAVEKFSLASSLDKNNYVSVSYWGLALFELGQSQAAIVKLQEAIDRNSNAALPFMFLGNCFLKENKLDLAVKNYTLAVQKEPTTSYLYNNFANALVNQGKFELAIEKYHTAINLNSESPLTYSNLGVALGSLGKYEQAIQMYQKAIKLKPDSSIALVNWGNALYEMEQFKDAIEKYSKAIEFDQKNSRIYNNLGNALSKLNRQNEAVDQYKIAIDLDPRYAKAYANLADTLLELNHPEKASEAYTYAVNLGESDASLYFNWGKALLRIKNFDQSIEKFKMTIEIEPQNTGAFVQWGIALLRKGNRSEAKHKWIYARSLTSNKDKQAEIDNLLQLIVKK